MFNALMFNAERKKNSRIMRRVRIIVIPGLLVVTVLLGVFLFLRILKTRKVKKEGNVSIQITSYLFKKQDHED